MNAPSIIFVLVFQLFINIHDLRLQAFSLNLVFTISDFLMM